MSSQLTARNSLLFNASGEDLDASCVLTTANDIIVNPKSKSIEYKEIGSGQAGNTKSKSITDFTTAEFSVEINAKPSGDKSEPPSYGELFKCCGLSETATDDNVTYAPATLATGHAKAYLDGAMREITGIAGDFTFGGKVGEIAKFTFSLKGFTTLDETAEDNPDVTLGSNTNLTIESIAAITVGGNSVAMEDFEFSLGNEIQETYAIGLKEYYISDFKPTIKVNAVKTKGNSDHWKDLASNTLKEIVVKLGEDEDGQKLEFRASYCNPSDVSESDSSGKIVYSNTWSCENKDGGDNFSIVYS